MPTRREFLGHGLGALGMGLLARRGFGMALPADGCVPSGAIGLLYSRPVTELPRRLESIEIAGLPFARWFTGDDFEAVGETHIPLPTRGNFFGEDSPPEPSENVDVVVVGGGLSGLASAYMLREFRPVVLELHPKFGGNAQGEEWAGTRYSLGSAYVIVPDEGSFLDGFYRDLGLHRVERLSEGDDPVELYGQIRDDFWTHTVNPADAPAFQRYAEVVTYMAEKSYPDIPLPSGKDNEWILALDRKTLKEDLEERMNMPMPPLLAAGVQAYCYSSFGAGMEEISAAGGWNFLAAEEYGRWVFPGGNSYIVQQLWERLARMENASDRPCGPQLLRAGCTVVDVRLRGDGVQVSYLDSNRTLHSLAARQVVMACPKLAARNIIHELKVIDPDKLNAMYTVDYFAYVVANVLLDAPIERDFYDVFLLSDGNFPTDQTSAEQHWRVTDMLNGHYARRAHLPRSVLTLYWPLPWPSARFNLLASGPYQRYAERIAPQIQEMLSLLKVPASAVRQVRITRWGHAMPLSRPFFIADGHAENVRRPIEDKIWFIEQDNWALPAVENSLLDAETFVPQIAAALRQPA